MLWFHRHKVHRVELVVWVHNRHHHRHHHRNRYRVIILHPNQRAIMGNINVTVGHTVSFSLVFLDQDGHPMLSTPVADAAPVWSQSTPATGTLTASSDGLTASEATLAAGTDAVSVALAVSGAAFSATIDVNVQAAPQVLTSVQIAASAS